MRIALVTHRSWPGIGGAETYVRQLARQLSGRHDIVVLAHRIDDGPAGRLTDSLRPPPTFEPFSDGNVFVKPLRVPLAARTALAPLALQVVPVLRRYAYRSAVRRPATALYARVVGPTIARSVPDAEIVHVFSGGLLGAASVRAARLHGVPVVVTGFIHRHSWGDDPASASVYRSADAVVAQLRTEAEIYGELGVDEQRIVICGSGTPGLKPGGGAELRRRREIGGSLVAFAGVRREGKGHDLLLQAAALVANDVADLCVAFIGPGAPLPERAGAARIIDAGPLRLEDPERDAWFDAADVICLPSDAESFGIVVAEAWSLRKPVVVSDIATLRELVGEPAAGLVSPRNASALALNIVRVLRDSTLARELGDRGYELWERRYNTVSVANAHEALYQRLVTGA